MQHSGPPDWSWSPGDTINMSMSVLDWDNTLWDQWPQWSGTGHGCTEPGSLILAGRSAPSVPVVSLWGTVGMATLLAGCVVWAVRRRVQAGV